MSAPVSIDELLVRLTVQLGQLIERLDRLERGGGLVHIDRVVGADTHCLYIRRHPTDADPPR